MKYFDMLLIVFGLGTGLFSLIMPERAWHLLQSKKVKAQTEYSEKEHKQMIIGGIIILVLATAFLVTTIIY